MTTRSEWIEEQVELFYKRNPDIRGAGIRYLMQDAMAFADVTREVGGVRYGYEYSPANKAYEIAPIGSDGELDWKREVCITADDREATAKMIVRALNITPAASEEEAG